MLIKMSYKKDGHLKIPQLSPTTGLLIFCTVFISVVLLMIMFNNKNNYMKPSMILMPANTKFMIF